MQCRFCDRKVEDDSRFCRFCGRNIETSPPADRALQPPPEDENRFRDPQQEKGIWEGRPAWRSFGGAWAVWLAASGFTYYLVAHYTQSDSAFLQVVFLFIAGFAIALLVREALIVYGLRYKLTTQRLFIHRGILTRVTDQMELLRIDDVRLSQGVVDRLVDTGDLDIYGSDETDEAVTLHAISAPAEVAEAVRRHVRGARGKNTLAVESI